MSCSDKGHDIDNTNASRTTVSYVESDEDFANPDRGFYRYSETFASNYVPLDESTLKTYRTPNTSSSANYQTVNTLVFRYFILDEFSNSPINSVFLDNVKRDFEAARNAGVKLIPRFTYTINANSGACSESFICPPYGDAPKEIVLKHIEQLAPILRENSDVISALQMGFIGTWGENYYTDYFGDASSNANQGKLLDENWRDRIDVLKALLDNTPNEMMVQVRYPQMKQRAIYGIDANTQVAALTGEEAFGESQKSRIGFHNDCLFASPDDFGTYADYGNSSTPAQTDIANLKEYFKTDSRYVIVGGETCFDGYSPENDCSPAGMADIDLEALHYTYLNADYNNEVNNDWVEGGCIDVIKKRLGYRLVLREGDFPNSANAGDSIKISLAIENVGFAAPMHIRKIFLILRNKDLGIESKLSVNTDIRKWAASAVTDLDFSVVIQKDLTAGDYELYLELEDVHNALKNRPEYNIRVANKNTWLADLGYNDLNHKITIE